MKIGSKHKYEVNEIARIIKLKEKNGHDATFERDLLKEWSTYSGWEYAGECLQGMPLATGRKIRRVKGSSMA